VCDYFVASARRLAINPFPVKVKKTRAELEAETKRLRRQLREADYIGGKFVGSKKRKTFHRPNCDWATYIKPPRRIEFDSHQEAVDAGYKPCKTCRA
jgi:methylphosphotriester-DNA--protein-cysteine methyltransferase